MTPLTRIAVNGASGRMGRRIIALGSEDPSVKVCAALEHRDNPSIGRDAGSVAGIEPLGVSLSGDLQSEVDVVIDFSVPEATESVVAICREKRIPLVLATTGLSDHQRQHIREAAQEIALVWAPNMSAAVNLTMKLAELAATTLKGHPGGADVEIIERHHRFKEDAPSGTALKFGEIIAKVMGQTIHTCGREGRPGQRPQGEIAYHALRVGDNPGEHPIVFGLLGETLELTIRATNRDSYALGALTAAKFVSSKPAGLYSMKEVLGL